MAQQGDNFTIGAIGGQKSFQQAPATQGFDLNSLIQQAMGNQQFEMGGVNTQQEVAPQQGADQAGQTEAPYNTMQAKQALDQREEAWQGIVGGDKPQAAGQAQDAGQQNYENQVMMQNVRDQQQGADLDSKQDKITDEELQKVFGDEAGAIRELLNKRSDVKLSDLLPLKKDPEGLDAVVKTLTKKTDLQVSDLVTKGTDGKTKVDASLGDDECKELMESRDDIKPKELTALKSQLTKALGNPMLAKKAFTQAIKLLKTRTDMKPEDVGTMFTGISEKMDSLQGSKDKSASGGGAKIEMFETAVDLLCTRRDLDGEKVLKLVDSTVQTMGDPKDNNSASRVNRVFKESADLLKTRQDISVDQVTGFMGNLQQMAPGKEQGAMDNRASIFSSACTMLKQRPDMDFNAATELLKRQTQGEPPKKGNKLMTAFNDAATGLAKGQTMDQVAPPVNQPDTKKTDKKDDKKTGEHDEKDKKAEGPEGEQEGQQADEPGKPGKAEDRQDDERQGGPQAPGADGGPQIEQQGGPGGR